MGECGSFVYFGVYKICKGEIGFELNGGVLKVKEVNKVVKFLQGSGTRSLDIIQVPVIIHGGCRKGLAL